MTQGGSTVPRKLGPVALAAWFALWLAALGALAAWRSATPLAPAQPIAYPHTIHAGRLGIPCTFCHANAAVSPQATVPPLSVCMTCHETIALDRPEVQKLRGYVARKEPVTWVKVHDVPAFVRFTHERHIKSGVDCSACHGGVAMMPRVQRVRPLTMGWCIGCHRTKGAPTDCTTCHK